VQFLLRIEDVTKEVMDSLKGLSGAERVRRQSDVLYAINKRMSDASQNIETRVSSLFKGNQFLAFVYQRYTDIRLVGAPPESVGKFGGDTDNWEWPRHTGDFSVFRVYASKENKPAAFSTDNVPYTPKSHLKVSIKGVKEGDYTMILGYPGRTNRYETSNGVLLAQDVVNPAVVKLREQRLAYMLKEMQKDPAIKIKMAGEYANIANYWKYFIGQTEQLKNLKVYEEKTEKEKQFKEWAKYKAEYNKLFDEFNTLYADYKPYALQG